MWGWLIWVWGPSIGTRNHFKWKKNVSNEHWPHFRNPINTKPIQTKKWRNIKPNKTNEESGIKYENLSLILKG